MSDRCTVIGGRYLPLRYNALKIGGVGRMPFIENNISYH
jgi:hypothetical protein